MLPFPGAHAEMTRRRPPILFTTSKPSFYWLRLQAMRLGWPTSFLQGVIENGDCFEHGFCIVSLATTVIVLVPDCLTNLSDTS